MYTEWTKQRLHIQTHCLRDQWETKQVHNNCEIMTLKARDNKKIKL